MLHFEVKSFQELENEQLYQILRLRSEVFVVEQNCVYQDIDNKDQIAIHVLGYHQNELAAYTRLFAPNDYYEKASIGRVIVKPKFRDLKLGHELMTFSINEVENQFNTTKIKIGAQSYLIQFYGSHGFQVIGEEYIEDGIPHTHMIRE